jgi:hypothetical protein
MHTLALLPSSIQNWQAPFQLLGSCSSWCVQVQVVPSRLPVPSLTTTFRSFIICGAGVLPLTVLQQYSLPMSCETVFLVKICTGPLEKGSQP